MNIHDSVKCLDHGFVRLVDHMGNDESIEQAARVSYLNAEKRNQSNTRGLIRYLMRHRHTTPFEMVQFKFHAKMPIFVARQWVRHRTASLNEISGRYSVLDQEFYMPEKFELQSKSNKQGRDNLVMDEDTTAIAKDYMVKLRDLSSKLYNRHLKHDVAKEIARIDLPLSIYTQWYWSINLHNLFHFLGLRLDSHAQYEIRVYAEAMAKVVSLVVPFAWEAFCDYRINGRSFSYADMEFLRFLTDEVHVEKFRANYSGSDREWKELRNKFAR